MNHDTLTDGKRCGVPGKHEGITHPVIRGFKKKKKDFFHIYQYKYNEEDNFLYIGVESFSFYS